MSNGPRTFTGTSVGRSSVTFQGMHRAHSSLEIHQEQSWQDVNYTGPAGTLQPSPLLLQNLSNSRRNSMRRSSVGFNRSESCRRSLLPMEPQQESYVGFMLPTQVPNTHDPDQATGRNSLFNSLDCRRLSSAHGHQAVPGKLSQNRSDQGQASGQVHHSQSPV